jgi:thioredoxin
MELLTTEQLKERQNNGEKLMVDFFATWCGPCKALLPRLERMESEYPDVKFVKINVDENMEYAGEIGIRSVPTVAFFNGNNLITMSVGANTDGFYKDILSKL